MRTLFVIVSTPETFFFFFEMKFIKEKIIFQNFTRKVGEQYWAFSLTTSRCSDIDSNKDPERKTLLALFLFFPAEVELLE